MAKVIGARLQNDGTLYANEPQSYLGGGFDETGTTKTGHSITKTFVYADEFDEVTISSNFVSGGSIALNGTNQRIEVQGTVDFQFGVHDFTIEGWFYLTSTSYTRLWCFPDGDNVEVQGGDLYYWNGGASIIHSGIGSIPQNYWFHVALVKYNGMVTVYVNGVSKITDNNPFNSQTSRPFSIGGEIGSLNANDNPSTAGWLAGKVTNIRIIKGTALYTENFSTPYAPFNKFDDTVLLLNVVDNAHLIVDSSGRSQVVTNVGNAIFDVATPLSTVYNGAMKQLKSGTLQVGNEFDETQVLA
jgi:hypothetical protein